MRAPSLTNGCNYNLHYRVFHDESDEHVALMSSYTKDLLSPHLPDPNGKSLLDVGCGMGFAMRAMREYGFERVHGIDISPEQIAACKRLEEAGELVEDSRLYLTNCPKTFDVALLLDVLEHVPVIEQIDLMRAVFGVLKPTGRAILQVPNANSPLASRWRYVDFTHCSSFTEYSLSFVLRSAGFSRVDIPGQGPVQRPPLRFWRRSFRKAFCRWFIRFLWRQVLIAELGSFESIDDICLELNLLCVAYK